MTGFSYDSNISGYRYLRIGLTRVRIKGEATTILKNVDGLFRELRLEDLICFNAEIIILLVSQSYNTLDIHAVPLFTCMTRKHVTVQTSSFLLT